MAHYSVVWRSLMAGLVLAGGLSSCHHAEANPEEAQVKTSFETCKANILANRADRSAVYIPKSVDDYILSLKADPMSSPPPSSASPSVDLFLRRALQEKVPPDLRTGLTFSRLLQRIEERRLLNSGDVQGLELGRVSINGDTATAELYFQGTLLPMNLPFVREEGVWKIDLLASRPYAETLMRVDRTLRGQTEDQQVEVLVSQLPSL